MKTKIIFTILIILLALSITASITAFAVTPPETQAEEETLFAGADKVLPNESVSFAEYIRDGAPETRSLTLQNGHNVNTGIFYKNSRNTSLTSYYDVFTDENGREYWYNETNTLIMEKASAQSYMQAIKALKGKERVVDTEEKAEQIAREHAEDIYGSIINDCATQYIRHDEGMKYYTVSLAPTYGEDGFIIGQYCYVDVLIDGTVTSCSMTDIGTFADFDENSVADIKKDTVYANAELVMDALYGDELVSCEITEVRLVKTDGKYGLLVLIDAELADYSVGETVYYEIN